MRKIFAKGEQALSAQLLLAEALEGTDGSGAERSVLGPTVRVTGKLECDDCVEVRGMVDGDVNSTVLIVGEEGYVDGFISADAVHIAGTVTGRIEAVAVTIAGSATVIGSIIHNSLEVEKGAKLDGPRPWRPMSFMAELRPSG